MTIPIVIGFEDFKKLADNKRIYYYIGDNFYEFSFLTDGTIVKTALLKDQVPNPKQFFSDRLFYGAMELKFRIPDPDTNSLDSNIIKSVLKEPIVIQEIQDEEVKNEDIQRDGVDADEE